jgi:hypothetical protein
MEARDVSEKLVGANSVLIVSCPICPPISVAMQTNTPFIELFKHGLNTESFEAYIDSIREPLEQRGVRTGVYRSHVPCPTMCLWTKGQRDRFRKRAQGYEAVVVLGCDTARYTVRQALKDTRCRVVQGMRTVGMTNAALKFDLPMTITLEDKVRIGQDRKVEEVA